MNHFARTLLYDTELTKRALCNFVYGSQPDSPEEINSLNILTANPFFRLPSQRESYNKNDSYYAGQLRSPLGKFFTQEVFLQMQQTFKKSLHILKSLEEKVIADKLESLSHLRTITNLKTEAILEVMGYQRYALFVRSRTSYMAKLYPRQLTIILTYKCNLSCNFCFSKQLERKHPGYLEQHRLLNILEWMEGKGFTHVSLFGGEPTIHPEFTKIIRQISDRGYKIYFATNGLYSDEVAEALINSDILKMTLNVPASMDFPNDKLKLLRKNLKRLPMHINKSLRLTLSSTHRDLTILKGLLDESKPDSISFALAFPDEDGSNAFVLNEEIHDYVFDILNIAQIANDRNLGTALVKPIPFCMFSESELLSMLDRVNLFAPCDISCDNYKQLTTLSHDGIFYPCISLPSHGHIQLDNNPTLTDISNYNRSVVELLSKNPVLEKCLDCNLYNAHICQGFCYSYFSLKANLL